MNVLIIQHMFNKVILNLIIISVLIFGLIIILIIIIIHFKESFIPFTYPYLSNHPNNINLNYFIIVFQ